MAGFDNDVCYGTNVDFTGGSPITGQMVSDGQLLIGASVAPFIRANTLTAGTGISITNGPGTITITNTGGGGGGGGTNTLSGNSGSATQSGGVISVPGSNGLSTSGSGNTLSITTTGSLLALNNLAGTGYVVQTGANTFTNRTFVAGSGITLTNADGVAGPTTITASTAVPLTFTEDSGSAAPAANNLNVLGTSAQGISTSGAGSTVTITASNATALQKGVASFDATNFTVTSGAVTSNPLTVTAGTGLTGGGSVNLGGTITLNLSTPVSVSNGGTGDTSLTTNGVLYGNGTSPVGVTSGGTNGQALIAATGLPPAWATIGGTQGVTLTGGANTLSIGLSGVPNSALANSSITVAGGSGITVTGSPVSLGGTVTISANGTILTQLTADSGIATPSSNNINILGTGSQGISTSASGATVTLTVANATTISKGVASFNATDFSVSSGAVSLNSTGAGKTITGDNAVALSPTLNNWNIFGGTNITTSGAGSTLTVSVKAPFAATSLTANSLILGNGSSNVSALGAATNGQLPIGNTGSAPTLATLTAGTGISISNGAGSITITNSSPGSFTPNQTIQDFDDFLYLLTGTGSKLGFSSNGWSGVIPSDNTTNPGQVVNLSSTPGLRINTQQYWIGLGGGSLNINFVFKIAIPSAPANRYTIYMGITDVNNVSVPNNGCYFIYSDNINSGNWQIECSNGGTRTTLNTNVAANTSWNNFGIRVNAAGTSVAFSINGVDVNVSPITTNIPTTNKLNVAIITPVNVGSLLSSSLFLDLFYYTQTLTVAR